MKNFFTQYLPTEGKVKKGDVVFTGDVDIKRGNRSVKGNFLGIILTIARDGYCTISTERDGTFYVQRDKVKPAKLFLCTHDIQVGDIGYIHLSRTAGETFDRTGLSGEITYIQKENGHINVKVIQDGKEVQACEYLGHVFKVLGQISPDACEYVHPGTSIKEEDVEEWWYNTQIGASVMKRLSEQWDEMIKQESHMVTMFKVRCPSCKKYFH